MTAPEAVVVSYRLGGADGVAVEAAKWEWALRELGFTVRRVAGGGRRALGWDKKSGYSSNRGEGFSNSAYGHGGFTGTVLWIDPQLDLFLIFLSNRLHPDGKGVVNPLAGRIGTIVAAAIVDKHE